MLKGVVVFLQVARHRYLLQHGGGGPPDDVVLGEAPDDPKADADAPGGRMDLVDGL